MALQEGQQQAGAPTIGEGSVGVSELIKEGVGEGPNGCHPGHWTVVQQLGDLQQTLWRQRPQLTDPQTGTVDHELLTHA